MWKSTIWATARFPIDVLVLIHGGIMAAGLHARIRTYASLLGIAFLAMERWIRSLMTWALSATVDAWHFLRRCWSNSVDDCLSGIEPREAHEWITSVGRWLQWLVADDLLHVIVTLGTLIAIGLYIWLGSYARVEKWLALLFSVPLTGLVMLSMFELALVTFYGGNHLPVNKPALKLIEWLHTTRLPNDYCKVVYPQLSVLLYLFWAAVEGLKHSYAERSRRGMRNSVDRIEASASRSRGRASGNRFN